MNSIPPYTALALPGIAEPLSALSHLFAAAVFACLALVLVRRARPDTRRARAVTLYAGSVVTLLIVSGVYHLFPRHFVMRDLMQRLDHAAIFVVIAATFTPIHLILLEGVWRHGVLKIVWSLAAIGIVISLLLLNTVPEAVCLSFYLGLGWLGMLTGVLLWARFGFRFILPLLLGALAYTSGAVIDFVRAPVLINGVFGPHELFHFAVIAGLSFHWLFISSFVNRAVVQCRETRAFLLIPHRVELYKVGWAPGTSQP